MSEIQKLPANYRPLDELDFCSNILIGGGFPIGIEGFAPLIIGAGFVPQIWLYTKDDNKWISLIEGNISHNSSLILDISESERSTVIKFNEAIIMKCKMEIDTKCTVEYIDLRPIGFNLVGADNKITIGDRKIYGNTFQNVAFMIGLGG